MADSLASIGAHVAATSTDPVQLHMQAVNDLARCKAMLCANEPMYLYAKQCLESALRAVDALWDMESSKFYQ